jgi:hypothetical protein
VTTTAGGVGSVVTGGAGSVTAGGIVGSVGGVTVAGGVGSGIGAAGSVTVGPAVIVSVGGVETLGVGVLGAGAQARRDAVRIMTPIKAIFVCMGIPFIGKTFALYSLETQTCFYRKANR